MRHFRKDVEPRALTDYKREGGSLYVGGNLDKSDIQKQLLKEQKGLCAYCMRRIDAVQGNTPQMIIEHVKCRDLYPALQLDYKNMLGVCFGVQTILCIKNIVISRRIRAVIIMNC